MSARAQMKPDFDGPEDRQLADDIARAMHHRPLMSRLARVHPATGSAPAAAVGAHYTPPALTETPQVPFDLTAELPGDARSLEEVIDDLGDIAAPPPSAMWLEKAQHAHRQARARRAVAWVTTFAIGTSIVGVALLLLHV